ncbi:MAG: GGDEF domain-containing protein [Rhodoferax sp.]|nr:GGDEF domain-containing protein [Rhodoferax sp.]
MQYLRLFVLNLDVARLDARLATLDGAERLSALVELAWHLRQRDCKRTLTLLDEAQVLMASVEMAEEERQRIAARITLTRAEERLVFADLESAEQLTEKAAAAFEQLGDRLGMGDAMWTLASISIDQGNGEKTDGALVKAAALFAEGGDTQRQEMAMGRRLVYSSFRDPVATGQMLAQQFPGDEPRTPFVDYWISTVKANVAGLTNDPGASVRHDLAGYQFALEFGLIRQALVSANNAAESFAMLGDLDAALEWSDLALALARSTGWPASIGVCLLQTGDVLRMLGRYDEARTHLQEALSQMDALSGSRNYEQVLGNLGQVELDVGDYAAALEWFEKFEVRVDAHHDPDLITKSWRGQADALHHLGRKQEANAKANMALALAKEQGNADGQIQILSVLAQIHRDGGLQPQDMSAPSPALHYLHQAIEIAAQISGYQVSPELLNQLAASYAAVGDYRTAYENSVSANEARNQGRREEAHRRALAIQIRQEVERAKAETDRHREMAAALRETAATLETLGTIGREITASLDSKAVFDALHRHVNELLDATVFAIYLIDEEHKFLVPAFAMEQGAPMPARPVALANPTSKSARSARRREEVIQNLAAGQVSPNLIPGTLPTFSMLYFPLVVGERLLGVMSIQSPRLNAYGEREQSIFRALCAYGAIALDNAAAYSAAENAQRRADQALTELRETQARLVEQNLQLERLAVTDQLTGLFNRLRLDHTLEEEHSRNMRYGTSFCVLLLDIDQFKAVNDTYGHQTGDEVLVGIASTLQEGIREVDVAGRWGGEEFLIICRETALDGAMILAEKLRQAVQARVYDKVGQMSASFGVAMFRPGEVLTETIARADAALYRAKQAGRNRVENGEV